MNSITHCRNGEKLPETAFMASWATTPPKKAHIGANCPAETSTTRRSRSSSMESTWNREFEKVTLVSLGIVHAQESMWKMHADDKVVVVD